MPKGRKVFRGKGGELPPDSQKDFFEEDLDVSTEEEEDDADKGQDDNTQMQESQDVIEDSQVQRPESPVLLDLKRPRTKRKYASLTATEEVNLVEWYCENELFTIRD